MDRGELSPTMVHVHKVDELAVDVEPTDWPRFAGKLGDKFPLKSLRGLSGGPIYGFPRDFPNQYWIAAIQSSSRKDIKMTSRARSVSSSGVSGPRARCGRAAIALTEEIADLLTDVMGAMEEVRYGARDTFAVRLALQEAVINAVKHGHGNDPRQRVRICWVVSASAVRLVVEDDGAGFDPHLVPDPRLPENQERPGGRGVFLMRSYMSWLRFNDAGNRVLMCRYRS